MDFLKSSFEHYACVETLCYTSPQVVARLLCADGHNIAMPHSLWHVAVQSVVCCEELTSKAGSSVVHVTIFCPTCFGDVDSL